MSGDRQAFETIESDYDIDAFTAQAAASYTVDFGSAYLTPLVGVQYGVVSADGYTENGGLNIAIDDTETDYLEGRVGFTLGKQFNEGGDLRDYFIRAALVNDFGGGADDLDIAFSNQALSLQSFDADDLRVNGQIGYNWISGNALSLGAVVGGDLSDSYTSVSGNMRVKYNF